MGNITTAALFKSIMAAKTKETPIAAIARATQGKEVPAKTIDSLHTKLVEAFEAQGSTKPEIAASQITKVLKASKGLPAIIKAAKELFADNNSRKGSEYRAIQAGITSFNNNCGHNAIVEEMAKACPVYKEKEKELAELVSLLTRARDKCADAGHGKMKTQLDNLLVAAK